MIWNIHGERKMVFVAHETINDSQREINEQIPEISQKHLPGLSETKSLYGSFCVRILSESHHTPCMALHAHQSNSWSVD